MAEDVRVVLFPAEIARLATDPPVVRAVRRDAQQMARRAAVEAPKHTGRGAASIQADRDPDELGAYRVSWDQGAYYMVFVEEGHQSYPGKAFLQRTFESYRHLD
jgi:hypothetical protein